MSLEEVIKENTAAVKELTEALKAQGGVATPPAEPAKAARGKPKNKETEAPVVDETETDAEVFNDLDEPEGDGAEPITYDQVSDAIKNVAREMGRETAMDFLSRFGAKTGKDIKEDQYAAVVKHAEHVLAGGDV